MPFFSVTCAFGACHDSASRQAGLDLGPNFNDGPPDGATLSDVLANLLAASTTTPDLPRVTPFDPARNFLMLKLEGCQNRMGLRCKVRSPHNRVALGCQRSPTSSRSTNGLSCGDG